MQTFQKDASCSRDEDVTSLWNKTIESVLLLRGKKRAGKRIKESLCSRPVIVNLKRVFVSKSKQRKGGRGGKAGSFTRQFYDWLHCNARRVLHGYGPADPGGRIGAPFK